MTPTESGPLTPETISALVGALDAAEHNDEAKTIVFDFSNGDVGPLGPGADAVIGLLLERLRTYPKRLYAAVGHSAIEAGLDLVLLCDGVYTSPQTTLSFGTSGRIPNPASVAVLRQNGDADAVDALLAGETLDAIATYVKNISDGILVGKLASDIAPFARREAALPRGRYHAASNS